MPYAVSRLYTVAGAMSAEQLSSYAINELAPKLGKGLQRYSVVALANGGVGSFSIYDNQAEASRAAQIAAEWVKSKPELQGFTLTDTIEGEVVFAAGGGEGAKHSLARIYKSDASAEDLQAALEQEAGEIIRNFPGLVRYGVIKTGDGRVGMFSAFDTQENARNSSQQAKTLRGKAGTRLAMLLPSDPEVIEGTPVGLYLRP